MPLKALSLFGKNASCIKSVFFLCVFYFSFNLEFNNHKRITKKYSKNGKRQTFSRVLAQGGLLKRPNMWMPFTFFWVTEAYLARTGLRRSENSGLFCKFVMLSLSALNQDITIFKGYQNYRDKLYFYSVTLGRKFHRHHRQHVTEISGGEYEGNNGICKLYHPWPNNHINATKYGNFQIKRGSIFYFVPHHAISGHIWKKMLQMICFCKENH